MNQDRLAQRITLICVCFCVCVLCLGVLVIMLEGLAVPASSAEIILGLAGYIFAFLAASPLQK